jgi:hypothetical protein
VRKADWSFEIPPATADAAGIEDYEVESAVAEPLGKVKTLLRRDGELYLALEAGVPPLVQRIRAVPWEEIGEIDHDSLTVRLRVRADELHRYPVLDADRATEGGDAEAVRVTEVPDEEPRTVSTDDPGPVDRPSYLAALVTGLLGAFTALLAVVVITVTDGAWRFAVLAVPALLIVLSAVLAYRFFRRPSEGL